MEGYVKLYRSLLAHPLWASCPDAWLRIALACLLSANWKSVKWWNGREEVDIPAGSFITSSETLAKLAKVSRQQVRLAFQYFAKSDFATSRTTNRYTHVTITNWSAYQSDDDTENQQKNQRGTSGEPAGNHKQERKKGRSREEQSRAEADSPPIVPPSSGEDGVLMLSGEPDMPKPKKQKQGEMPRWKQPYFEAFWEVVWHRVGKGKAKRAYHKATKTTKDCEFITAAAKIQGPSIVKHAQDNNHSILHVSTWLNQGRYEDDGQTIQPVEEAPW